jgi:hypothetical protein
MLARNLLLLIALGTAAMPAIGRVNVDIIVDVGPPPPRVVVVPGPRPGYIWAPGYWYWEGGRYVWFDGRWVRSRPGYYWVPERWEHREDRRYHFAPGRWERDRDRGDWHDRGERHDRGRERGDRD